MFPQDHKTGTSVDEAKRDFYEYLYFLNARGRDDRLAAATAELAAKEPDFPAGAGRDASGTTGAPGSPSAPGGADAAGRFVVGLRAVCEFLEQRGYIPVDPGEFPRVRELLASIRADLANFARLSLDTPPRSDPPAVDGGPARSDRAALFSPPAPAPASDDPRRAIPRAPAIRMAFARYLADRGGYRIQWSEAPTPWFGETGFVSWLLVRRANPLQLYIVYAREKIDGSVSDDLLALEQRYEKIFLHELGHVRLHAEVLRDSRLTTRSAPEVFPVHEVEASLYASMVRGMAIGMSSCLDRLLGQADEAWKG